jgi:DNA-binding MarR family transcriptional regulator
MTMAARLRLDDYLPYRLSVAAHAVSTLIADACLREFALPIPQWRVLSILSEHRFLRQQDIVPLSTMDKQTVSRAVRALQRRRLLSSRLHPDDGRARALRLTSQGRTLYGRIVPTALRLERELLASMPVRDRKSLARSVRSLQQAAVKRMASDPAAANMRR